MQTVYSSFGDLECRRCFRPVEWKQITPFLLWQDYMATGTTDLAVAFQEQAYERTMIGFLDSTGLLETDKMGRHIVDWMPDARETDETVSRGEYSNSNHTSVSNAFGAHGLALLSTMLAEGGNATGAAQIAATAASLKSEIVKQMWNGTAFCDGPCDDVAGASKMMSNMFTLCFGMVPEANVAANWQAVADWGIEQIGDYGAFWWRKSSAFSSRFSSYGPCTLLLTRQARAQRWRSPAATTPTPQATAWHRTPRTTAARSSPPSPNATRTAGAPGCATTTSR